eukprot:797220-Rhodomonas_salina.4
MCGPEFVRCYTMCGSEIVDGAMRCAVPRTRCDVRPPGCAWCSARICDVRCLDTPIRMPARACYAMSGTDGAYGATSLDMSYSEISEYGVAVLGTTSYHPPGLRCAILSYDTLVPGYSLCVAAVWCKRESACCYCMALLRQRLVLLYGATEMSYGSHV